jgi:type IV pilus assembly protein PilB
MDRMPISDELIQKVVLASRLADEKKLAEIVSYAKSTGNPLQDSLVEKAVATDEKLGQLIAAEMKFPFVSLAKKEIPEDVLSVVPQRLARKFKIVAFARTAQGLDLAMADPTRKDIVELIEKKTAQKVNVHYATPQDLENAVLGYKEDIQTTIDQLQREDTGGDGVSDPPVAKIVNSLIESAYREYASDIHIEPQEKESEVRFRVDGELRDVLRINLPLHDRILTRIKVLSDLRTDEHLSAQDGKLRVQFDEDTIDIRVSILPIADGEKVVMRLLSSRLRQYSLADLGMNEGDLAKMTQAYSRAFGMILSTGPTGSGKTTTIYAMLKILNQRNRNITTIEDPIEYRIKGANQIQVNTKTNLTFANGLRSILRQDPNVIFVGEIRDSETAGIAVNAALTGHLVFSTLHTNDAATAVPRLLDLKVEPFLVASTVNVIVAQRLVRRICEACRASTTISEKDLLVNFPADIVKKHFPDGGEKKENRVYHGTGCKVCHGTGYSGRVGLFEVLLVTEAIRELITQRADADVIKDAAVKEGMATIVDDGLNKVVNGLTTVEEVLRVTKTEMA